MTPYNPFQLARPSRNVCGQLYMWKVDDRLFGGPKHWLDTAIRCRRFQQSAHFPFLDLPLELRHMVYRAWKEDTLGPSRIDLVTPKWPRWGLFAKSQQAAFFQRFLILFRLNAQIRYEALEYFKPYIEYRSAHHNMYDSPSASPTKFPLVMPPVRVPRRPTLMGTILDPSRIWNLRIAVKHFDQGWLITEHVPRQEQIDEVLPIEVLRSMPALRVLRLDVMRMKDVLPICARDIRDTEAVFRRHLAMVYQQLQREPPRFEVRAAIPEDAIQYHFW